MIQRIDKTYLPQLGDPANFETQARDWLEPLADPLAGRSVDIWTELRGRGTNVPQWSELHVLGGIRSRLLGTEANIEVMSAYLGGLKRGLAKGTSFTSASKPLQEILSWDQDAVLWFVIFVSRFDFELRDEVLYWLLRGQLFPSLPVELEIPMTWANVVTVRWHSHLGPIAWSLQPNTQRRGGNVEVVPATAEDVNFARQWFATISKGGHNG